jgi:phosphomevalonate kinase
MRANIHVVAPGKLFLGGEYAVLKGAEAVITAVDATAAASLCERARSKSPVIAAAAKRVSKFLSRPLSELPFVKIDSPGFQVGRRKIGLGSSAAVAAGTCGILFEWVGYPIDAHREKILDLATAAHRDAQGGLGSGADVACSVLGGAIVFSRGQPAESVDLSNIHLVAVWTGRAASTADLLRRINALALRDPALHGSCFEELTRVSAEIATAYRLCDLPTIISATRQYGESMKRLGEAAKAPIVVAEHDRASALASELGGAAKPSGAGGGDVAVAVFSEADAATRFRELSRERGLRPLDLVFGAQGLHRV